jgi:hypothetical protein
MKRISGIRLECLVALLMLAGNVCAFGSTRYYFESTIRAQAFYDQDGNQISSPWNVVGTTVIGSLLLHYPTVPDYGSSVATYASPQVITAVLPVLDLHISAERYYQTVVNDWSGVSQVDQFSLFSNDITINSPDGLFVDARDHNYIGLWFSDSSATVFPNGAGTILGFPPNGAFDATSIAIGVRTATNATLHLEGSIDSVVLAPEPGTLQLFVGLCAVGVLMRVLRGRVASGCSRMDV